MIVDPPWVESIEEADALIAEYAAIIERSKDEDVRRSHRLAIDEVLDRRELLVKIRAPVEE